MIRRSPWRREISQLLAWLGIGLVLGTLLEREWVGVLLASLFYLGWHLYGMAQLLSWLAQDSGSPPPTLRGGWGEVLRHIQTLQLCSRKRKRKMVRFLRRFREAAAALPDAAIVLGRRGEIEWCNPASQKLLGLDPGRVTGHLFAHLVRHPGLIHYLESGDYHEPVEIPAPVDDNRLLSCQITPFGKKYQRLLIARDETQIHQLDQVRRDFVANVSHELRTPLTVLRGFLEALGDEADECPTWARSVELMTQQSARMERIVNDLLTLSRLEMGDDAPSSHLVPVSELLSSIVQEARMLSGSQGHQLTLIADPLLGMRGNSDELRSAFANLVVNAVQHTPAGSHIQITWREYLINEEEAGSGGAEFSVADNGEGIPARHLPRLTERFYRVDKSRSRARGGTGLGLAIVKHVLTRYHSELIVRSELGQGSAFICHFPASVLYRWGKS